MVISLRPRLLASTSLALSFSLVGGGFTLPATALAGEDQAAVLGFEGDEEAADDFTALLRDEINARGEGSDRRMSLVELKLTMGCDDGDMGCIADGGATLGVEALVLGTLEKTPEGHAITVHLLDVGSKTISKTVSKTVSALDVKAATAIADDLFGGAEEEEPAPVAPAAVAEGPSAQEEVAPSEGGLYFGLEDETPTWKWIGFAASGGLMLASLGTAIGTSIGAKNASKDLTRAAEDSPNDGNPGNDISPNTGEDLCVLAREEVNPGEVKNAAMTTICDRGEGLSTASTIGWIGTGVFGLSTIIFGGLLFIHKKKTGSSALLDRGLQLGAAPSADGGLMFGGSVRF